MIQSFGFTYAALIFSRHILVYDLAYLRYANKRLFIDWLKLPIDIMDLTLKERADIEKNLGTISIAGLSKINGRYIAAPARLRSKCPEFLSLI